MVKFKCKHTGQVYTYVSDHDIEMMREHAEYEELEQEEEAEVKPIKTQRKQKDK